MERERWHKLDELLDGALDRPPEERRAWLDEACSGDEALRAEVERLLALAESEDDALAPNGALAGPLGEELAREIVRGSKIRAVRVGDELGPYRLTEFLGRGGMGEVFAAEDQKLGRRIALKLLPAELASPERRKRFEREAKTVASLNHPNIVHLYTVEEFEGIAFLTMELVQGSTLGELMPEGGFPLKKFLEIAVPLTDAIASAHEAGVVHRDVKPGNIMIGRDHRIKILDFGLAKLVEETRGPHFSADAESDTQRGHIIGTISHMSPEQAEGKSVDRRTDIFSLGVVLYEMCTGRLPFEGETPTAILSSIIKDTPPAVTDLNPRLPHELARIIRRCLAKDPVRRYQDAMDVHNDLEELAYQLDSRKLFQPQIDRPHRLRLVAVVLIATAVVASIAFFAGFETRTDRRPPPDILSGTFSQLTSEPGAELFPSLSPDGSFLVYASGESGNSDIYLLRAGGRRPINLTEDAEADDTQPAFSPDGDHIAFHSSREAGGLFIMGATGESARRLTDFGWNPAWSPDGESLVFATEPIAHTPYDRPTRSELWTVSIKNGDTKLLSEGDAVQPSWSPHGYRVAYWGLPAGSAQRDIYTISASGDDVVPVTEDVQLDWNPVWSPDGEYLYFSSDRGGSMNLWRVRIDERTGEVLEEPEPVRAPTTFASHVSFSRDGDRLAYAAMVNTHTLESAPFDREEGAGPLQQRARVVNEVSDPDVSPDGDWIVFNREGLQEDIVLVRTDGSEQRLLTDDTYRDRSPSWSPDGERIAFYSNRSGSYEIWSIDRDGSGLTQLTDLPKESTWYPTWSPDGKKMLFSGPQTPGLIFDPNAAFAGQVLEELPPYPNPDESFVPTDWSPDGKWIVAYTRSSRGVRAGIAVYSLETRSYEKLTSFGLLPSFAPDSRTILFQGLGPDRSGEQSHLQLDFKIFAVDRVTKEFREIIAIAGASTEFPVLSPDGHTLHFVRTALESDIWMLTAERDD